MINYKEVDWLKYKTLVFDFDGIFTENKVWVNQSGEETVRCDRGDGLAFDLLRTYKKLFNWNLELFILSKESNPVVLERAKKLKIKCFHGVDDKCVFLKNYLRKKYPKSNNPEKEMIYVGNDLNDLEAAIFSGLVIVPSDAHKLMQKNSNIISSKKGGEGFVRDLIEGIINIEDQPIEKIFQLLKKY